MEIFEAITHILMPHNKKAMLSFIGTINFVRRFIPNFMQIVKPLQQMEKQSVLFKWTDIENVSFKDIKTTIGHAPSLRIPYFENKFIVYTFSSNKSLATVLI